MTDALPRREFMAALAAGCGALRAAGSRPPNIVLILADDMGFSDLSCFGSEIPTPNIDSLARDGVRFTQFYNAARCCPSRAALLTGLYPHQAGMGGMAGEPAIASPAYQGDLSRRCTTLAEALRPHGYKTALSGKWHLTAASEDSRYNWPCQRGFDEFYGTLWGGGNYYNPAWLVRNNDLQKPPGRGYYYTDAITDHAAVTIKKYAASSAPFFSYVAYTAPHWPLHAPEEDIRQFEAEYQRGWDEIRQRRFSQLRELGILRKNWRMPERESIVPSWKDAQHKEWEARRMAVYAAMIRRMDAGVGRILRTLRETGQDRNSLVIFLSDNGGTREVLQENINQPAAVRTVDGRPIRRGNDPAIMPGADDTYQSYGIAWGNVSNTPFQRYKRWTHEGGIATPLLVRWPDTIRPGGIIQDLGHIIDIFPTCLEAAGVPRAQRSGRGARLQIEGESLLPLLKGAAARKERSLFWEHEGNRAARQGNWKLVAEDRQSWELYDMDADRTETTNLASKLPHRVAALEELYQKWAARTGVLSREEVMRLRANRGSAEPDASKS